MISSRSASLFFVRFGFWDICLSDFCSHPNTTEVKGIAFVVFTALKIYFKKNQQQHISRNGVHFTFKQRTECLHKLWLCSERERRLVLLWIKWINHLFQCFYFRAQQETLKVNHVMVNSLEDTLGKKQAVSLSLNSEFALPAGINSVSVHSVPLK